jgi:hypothetical protein
MDITAAIAQTEAALAGARQKLADAMTVDGAFGNLPNTSGNESVNHSQYLRDLRDTIVWLEAELVRLQPYAIPVASDDFYY